MDSFREKKRTKNKSLEIVESELEWRLSINLGVEVSFFLV